jgi:hypothetical protein
MRKIAATLVFGSILASCAPSTPQGRIAKNPEKFAELNKKNQDLVQQGQIARGMAPDAVKLAWGPPAQRFEGSKNSKSTERWDYAGATPVFFNGYNGGYGYGYNGLGPYGCAGYNSIGLGLGPEVAFVPYRLASVWFIDGRVDSWERAQ